MYGHITTAAATGSSLAVTGVATGATLLSAVGALFVGAALIAGVRIVGAKGARP